MAQQVGNKVMQYIQKQKETNARLQSIHVHARASTYSETVIQRFEVCQILLQIIIILLFITISGLSVLKFASEVDRD